MKINDTKLQSVTVTQARVTREHAQSPAERVASDAIPNQSMGVASKTSSATSTLSFDSKRVDEIKAAIANGTFKVDSGKIADGLINSVRDILGKK